MQKYKYKDKIYTIFNETKLKIGNKWEECVIYQTLYDNSDGEFWVRLSCDFYELFEKV